MEVDPTSSTTTTDPPCGQEERPSTDSKVTSIVPSQEDNQDDFLQTGRVGRRNAVPDIKTDPSSKVSTADLPMELEKLSCNTEEKDDGSDQPMDTSLPGTSSS